MSTFDDAATALLLAHPFFGSLLLKVDHKADDSVGTACISERKLTYSPEFFRSLDDDSAVFVVAHEVTHCVLQHPPQLREYIRTGLGPDGKPLDKDKLNRAMDYRVNAMLFNSGLKYTQVDQICYDPKRFPDEMPVPEIYCRLDNSGKGGAGGGKPLDQHDHEDHGSPAITPADVVAAARQAKAMGKAVPGEFQRMIDELTRLKVNPWGVIRKVVTASARGSGSTSWRRLNRKLIVRNIGAPATMHRMAGCVGIVVDTSGSIGNEMLQLFGGHMAAILDTAKPKATLLYWTDTRVAGRHEIPNGTALRNVLRAGAKGGGGTDMRVGVAAAAADNCDVIIVLTDGYTPFCDPPKGAQLIWAITTAGKKAPSGVTLTI